MLLSGCYGVLMVATVLLGCFARVFYVVDRMLLGCCLSVLGGCKCVTGWLLRYFRWC